MYFLLIIVASCLSQIELQNYLEDTSSVLAMRFAGTQIDPPNNGLEKSKPIDANASSENMPPRIAV